MAVKKVNGSFVLLKLGDNGGTPQIIGHSTEASISIEVDMNETTTKDNNGWAEHLEGGGLRKFSVEVSGMVALDDSGNSVSIGSGVLADAIMKRQDLDFEFDSSAVSSAPVRFSGKVTVSELTETYTMEEVGTYEGTLEGNGALTVDFGTV